jgi:nitrogen fixation/metabolism regulation signal transduction histidine kinase
MNIFIGLLIYVLLGAVVLGLAKESIVNTASKRLTNAEEGEVGCFIIIAWPFMIIFIIGFTIGRYIQNFFKK